MKPKVKLVGPLHETENDIFITLMKSQAECLKTNIVSDETDFASLNPVTFTYFGETYNNRWRSQVWHAICRLLLCDMKTETHAEVEGRRENSVVSTGLCRYLSGRKVNITTAKSLGHHVIESAWKLAQRNAPAKERPAYVQQIANRIEAKIEELIKTANEGELSHVDEDGQPIYIPDGYCDRMLEAAREFSSRRFASMKTRRHSTYNSDRVAGEGIDLHRKMVKRKLVAHAQV